MKNFIGIGKTEEEQVEQVKKWIKQNGIQIAVGITLGLSGIWGWDYYKNYQQTQAVEARSSYLAVVSNESKAFDNLQTNYNGSAYAQQGALLAAKYALISGNQQQALDYLLPLITSENELIVHIAKLRAASIYLEMGNYEQALSVIDKFDSNAFNGLYNNTKGDIYLAQKNTNLAKEYYQLALDTLSGNSRLKALIKIKLDDLN